ncbi:uncharacterized protein LOC119732177 [Patiria miniata]|uniref:Ig-like domain-containing protein n=1 Tax=Patiria miniata TaxID=46514 RepID=A0A914ACR5_PATMI|nr:uncharacterized protein LOC119732177 [Patiria miniata]
MPTKWTNVRFVLISVVVESITIRRKTAWNSEDAFGLRGSEAYLQRRLRHRVSCLAFLQGEQLNGVIWYKGSGINDPSKVRLISRDLRDGIIIDTPADDRYSMSSDHGLVIEGVKDRDEGSYLCQVLPLLTYYRVEEILLRVIGDTFPAGTIEASSSASFQRGRRQTLPCECASQTPDVVYWSTGEGVTTDTQIIVARFSDGATLQIQHGADYSIGSDASLTVNSLHDVQDTQKLWCHVFQSDGTLRNCDIDAQISDDVESASDALKASERSFYLQSNTQQMLPCLSWTPGDTACEVEWSKLDNPDRQILSYNLSTAVVDSSPEFDLASDFGLMIQSVDDDHAGAYRCAVGDEIQIDVKVRVIGDRIPLDGGIATEGDSVTIKPETGFSLQCPALSDISLTTKATLFWSFGANDAESTTVIGTLNLPDGTIKMSDLGKDCLGISMGGALLLNNCSQNDDVRYWCHVFPVNGDLIRSHVDVLLKDSNGDPETINVVAIAVSVFSIVVVLFGIVLFLIWKRRLRSSHSREDKERGDYKRLHKQESVPKLDLKTLAKKIKWFVISKMGRIPITPWVDGDDARSAPIDIVYKALEMFVNVSHGGNTVKYRLDSESGIFDDGIPELASKHAIIQGRRGCGKTTFLYRLIYNWAMGRELALWGSDQIVVLVPAWLLIKAETIGEAVVECMLPKDANISAESINTHYARDKSNLTILVDDCNDQHDIDAVMKVMTDNEVLGCQLVLTTRYAELAKIASRKHNMRHVTNTGFTLRNAIEYINVVLDAAQGRAESTPEHKVVKSEAETNSGSTLDTNIEQHLVDTEQATLKEAKDNTATDENLEKTEESKTTKRKKLRNLHRYLEEDILQPDISYLPAVLAALCQMSIWSKGDAFKPDVSMANLFFRLVKCMFDRMKGLEVDITEGKQLGLLTEDQLNVLAELGRVAYFVDSCSNHADYSTEDFLSSSEKGKHALEVAKEVGLLCPLQVESQVKSTQHSTETVSSEVPEVEIRTGIHCCKRKQLSRTDPDSNYQDTELTRLTSPQVERVYFVLEILEQLCVGVFFAQTKGNVRKLFAYNKQIGKREIPQRFSNVCQFAFQDNQFDGEALVDYCAKVVYWTNIQVGPLHVVLQLQKLIELCLQLNFERQCEGALNEKLKLIFPCGRVRLIGTSSNKLRLLSYLLEHAQPVDKSKLNITSVELLRIGRYDWSELLQYIVYFSSGKREPEDKETKKTKMEKPTKKKALKTKTEDTQVSSTGTKQARAPATQKGVKKLTTNTGKVSSSLNEPQPSAEKQQKNKADQTTIPDPRTEGDNKPKLEVLQYSPSVGSESSNKDGGNENESIDLSLDEDIASYNVIKSNNDQVILKQLCEVIHSKNQDMPRFPPGMSDISVLQTMQTFCLQELLDSQAGECYSSGAARDLARCLTRLEMLESLVLVGTILSSDAICELAKSAHQLPNLKKLDLRLNKEFDDRAFVAVTNLPLRECKKLSDLRLSLYGVTDGGFDQVQMEMKGDEHRWTRLKTLYLLHGSPIEKFVGFLSSCLRYFYSVESFHISAREKEQRISDNIQEEFETKMKHLEIMPSLESLDIGSMDTLKVRLASLKLPKKGILNKYASLGKKSVSSIVESVAFPFSVVSGVPVGYEVSAGN